MLKTIKKNISDHHLLKPHARVLVGLSGGADSICLCIILHSLEYEVLAVHCNFHLRGEESMRDELFATTFCERLGIECIKVDFDTKTYASEHKISIEMAARELRYRQFHTLKEEYHCEAIAVGHHSDDNIETMILNLSRGTGLKGLCGIQPRNDDIVRPLLCISRSDIENYLYGIGQNFITDHTNMEDAYARNKVRHIIIPELCRINSGARSNIITTIDNLNETRQIIDYAIAHMVDECCTTVDQQLYINKQKLMGYPSPISVLHHLLFNRGYTRSQLIDIISSIDNSGRKFSTHSHTLIIDSQHIVVEEIKNNTITYPIPLSECGIIEMKTVSIEELTINKSPSYAYVDVAKVHNELTVRIPKQGDSFAPFGMHGQHRLISDYLTDQKVNLIERQKQLLVCDGDRNIVWVVNRRSSEHYRIDDRTRQVIVLHYKS